MKNPESAISLSIRQARNVALAAQGFDRKASGQVSRTRILKMIRKVGVLQIDSVNVLSRAHYMPVFSRLGIYDRTFLDDLAWGKKRVRRLFEYWGHEASLIPMEDFSLFRWRMDDAANGIGMWGRIETIRKEQPALISELLARIKNEGPLAASDLDRPAGNGEKWWGWSHGKTALEYLFWSGQITAKLRKSSFERIYDLPERILEEGHLSGESCPEALLVPNQAGSFGSLSREMAQKILIKRAIAAMGVATEADIRKYFRLPTDETRQNIRDLVENGELVPAEVEGWKQPAFLDPDARIAARPKPTALLVPFDPLVWERDRLSRLFGFDYRIEIYVPAHKRQHGYYVLPFMLDGAFVARVDLKADRQQGVLKVQNLTFEDRVDKLAVQDALIDELDLLARFLGLEAVKMAHQ